MQWIDIFIIAVILAIFGLCGWFIYKSKKGGKKCIGCPDGGSCNGCCGCQNK